jgi:hypothetical protein
MLEIIHDDTDSDLDGRYRCLFCNLFRTTNKELWYKHTRDMHGSDYDTLVRELRVSRWQQRPSAMNATTDNQLVTTADTHEQVLHS